MQGELIWPPNFDPISQSHLWTPIKPYAWQRDVIGRCMKKGARVACVTPNESGKTSYVIPTLGLSWMAAFPGSMVVSTAGVERQIKNALWPVLTGALTKYQQWRMTDDLHIKSPSVRGLPPSEWEAFSARDAKAAEGFHSRWYEDENGKLCYAPLLIIIDEAKAFEDEELIFAFLNRCSPDALLMISTPGEDNGPFYDAFHSHRGDPWDCVEVGWHDCPHLREGFKLAEREQKIRQLGEEHPLVLSWVFGKFYRAGAHYVFDRMADVDWAMSGIITQIRGERRAALDFSAGGDEQVFTMRDGNTQLMLEAFHEKDTTVLGDMFIERFKRWGLKPEDIVGDSGGLGHACMDYLERRGWSGIRRYKFNDPARNSTYYYNRAAEDHYELKYMIQARSVNVLNDQKLKDQMRKRRYTMPQDDSNRIRLEQKAKMRDRGEDSPDRLDATVMLFSDMPLLNLSAAERLEIRDPAAKCGHWGDCFKRQEDEDEGSLWTPWMN